MKIRCTWHEPVFVQVSGRLVKAGPGDVIEVPAECADLLEQRGGHLFELVSPPRSPKGKAE